MFKITYKSGTEYTRSSFAEIDTTKFSPREIYSLAWQDVRVVFAENEFTFAHRMRRRIRVGTPGVHDHYCLFSTKRSVFCFPSGEFISTPMFGQTHAFFTDPKLEDEEADYLTVVLRDLPGIAPQEGGILAMLARQQKQPKVETL